MEQKINVSRLMLASIVSAFVIFCIGGLWHFIVFKDYYYNNPDMGSLARPDALLGFVIAGELLRSFVLTYFFAKMYPGGASMQDGLWFGLLAGILCAALWGVINYAALNLPSSWLVYDGSFPVVQGLAQGLVLAMFYKK